MIARGGSRAALFVALFFALIPTAVFASVRITEIMYNAPGGDDGREYVVVQNVGSSAISLTDFRFSSRSDKKDHRLRESVGSAVLRPGSTAVIVSRPEQFLQNYAYQGMLIDSGNFSLLNNGATISIIRERVPVHTVSYANSDGARGDGNALHVTREDTFISKQPSLSPLPSEEEKKDAVAAALFTTEKEKTVPVQQKETKRNAHTTLLLWFSVLLGVSALLASPLFLADKKEET
ncbi:MAG: lamin tail domain-containing protein [Candidatus Kaiserbacteria bacterium]|nr:lamin tail domain-containing protein [Candidatus Kaiserbacteria bacterium]